MATKKEWMQYVRDRKKYSKAYDKETIKLEKQLSKLPNGELEAFDGPGSNPGGPPPPPPPTPGGGG